MALVFFVVALLYASAGFGGGSTYTALLAMTGMSYQMVPIVSLCCNLVVVIGGVIHFSRAKVIPWRRALPIIAFSVPAAWVGGLTPISENFFVLLLGGTLLAAAVLLAVGAPRTRERAAVGSGWIAPGLGGGVGLLSGLVGIGGGIFLAPVLHLLGWATPRAIAGTASLFILSNSAAGLIGQIQKNGPMSANSFAEVWPLVLCVLVGGQIGSRLGAKSFPERWLRWVTAGLVFVVAMRLLISVAPTTIGW